MGARSGWVGSMEANTWCTRSHNGHWGWVSGWERWAWPRHGDGGRGGECGDPSQELLEVAERKWAAALVGEDGRKPVKRGLNGETGGMATSLPTLPLNWNAAERPAGRGQPRA